jgi:hypothetical protein
VYVAISEKCNNWSFAPKGARHQDELADSPSVAIYLELELEQGRVAENTECEEPTALEAVTRRLVKTQQTEK